MAQGEFLWCDLATFGIDNMLPTYQALFDWTFRSEEVLPGSIYFYANNATDVTAGIYEMPEDIRKDGLPSFWMSYVGVDDIIEGIDVVEAEGGRVIMGPVSFGMGASIAMIADPDGAILTLFSGSHLQNRPRKMHHASHFWNDLFSHDLDRSCNFYTKLFRWKYEASDTDGIINVRNLAGSPTARIQALGDDTPSGDAPHWAVSFAADDLSVIEARCDMLKLSKTYAPGMDGTMRLCITDQQGARFYVLPVDTRKVTWFT